MTIDPKSIPADMPRTDPKPAHDHPIDGWEVSYAQKGELGVLRIAKAPGNDPRIGLFIRKDGLMFPLAYFKNWHAAHRFAAWMEGASEPEPTLEQEYAELMKPIERQLDEGTQFNVNIDNGIGEAVPFRPASVEAKPADEQPKPKKRQSSKRAKKPALPFPKSPAR